MKLLGCICILLPQAVVWTIFVKTDEVCSFSWCCGDGCSCYTRYNGPPICECPTETSYNTKTMTPWSEWSCCSDTCGSGLKTRRRHCRGCCSYSKLEETRFCTQGKCPAVNGEWSTWSAFDQCSATCGPGIQMRKRTCSNSSPDHGGLNCSGISTESRQCNLRDCPVNGTWSMWGSYSACDKSCGGGWKVRFRDCSNPAPANGGLPCYGNSVQPTGCNMLHCPVDGGWSSWSNFSQCSSSCGDGVQTKSRTCSSPSPAYGGQQCSGNSKDSRICNLRACPVDGNWGQWSDFRPCDMTCGGGFHMRMRECNNPPPKHGGMNCPGQRIQAEGCNTQPCPDETKTTRSSSDLLIG